jgi:hypothetical protein
MQATDGVINIFLKICSLFCVKLAEGNLTVAMYGITNTLLTISLQYCK